MIYIKRILWLLGQLIMWPLSGALFVISSFVIVFNSAFLYIKNGNTQGCDNCLDWCIKLIDWYDGIEPKN